jgi:hypothetical protein
MNKVMNLWVPQNAGNVFAGQLSASEGLSSISLFSCTRKVLYSSLGAGHTSLILLTCIQEVLGEISA